MAYRVYGIINEDEENNIYAFGSHQLALYYWKKCAEENVIKFPATLIHIDYHSDFMPPKIDLDEQSKSSRILNLVKTNQIENDHLIQCALFWNMVENIFFCCSPTRFTLEPFTDEYTNHLSPVNLINNESIIDNFRRTDVLLSIDLDFFIDFQAEDLKKDEVIKEEIEAINELYKYSKVTTICTTPEGVWDEKHIKYIIEMLYKHCIFPVSLPHPAPLIYDFFGT